MPLIFPSRTSLRTMIAPGRIPSGVTMRSETKACPSMPEPIVPSRLFQLCRVRGSGLASSQKCFAYFLAPLILAALNICLNIGCERIHVDRFARRFVGSWDAHALDDYAMTEPSHMDKAFMARAIQLSLENVSSGRGGPFGA